MYSDDKLSDIETPMLKKPVGAPVSENQYFGSSGATNFVLKSINESGVTTKVVPAMNYQINQFGETLRMGNT
jgi:hypothetical protein